MKVSAASINLIKSFEGLSLTSYQCEAGVWTVGYGTTGPNIGPGLTITEQQAENFLHETLRSFENSVSELIKVKVNQNEFDALVSFTYNVGVNAFKQSTLLKLLNDGVAHDIVASELLRWTKVNGNINEGLANRRRREKELFLTKVVHPLLASSILAQRDTWLKRKPEQASTLVPEEKVFVPKGAAHEWRTITMVPGEIDYRVRLEAQPERDWWFYPNHWKIINDPKSSIVSPPSAPSAPVEKVLNIPYYSQRDNVRDPLRTCFSSSCAMMLKGLKPNSIDNDDKYIATVFKHGDTTSATAQLEALEDYGVRAEFCQNGSWKDIDAQLDKGIAVPIGILHKGSVTDPSGGGHWICVIGRSEDNKSYVVNDPFGELDLVNGGYISTNGAKQLYSKLNLKPRWMVEGEGSGWFIKASK
jgi:GH24 family phage-related lysozyme (muramidase)